MVILLEFNRVSLMVTSQGRNLGYFWGERRRRPMMEEVIRVVAKRKGRGTNGGKSSKHCLNSDGDEGETLVMRIDGIDGVRGEQRWRGGLLWSYRQ